ncbi:hypothetical protein HYPSUDRAFT_53480 [Hypholoma sublateritium FD-334 SS-4]|uniref:Uncharacterized protein n=1 Tax=Hypholoma sublateritium (strain FD-334 SS-4) TaxID=945553 RepID=A0A0D2P1Z6_HYPSF|nr:hypothetical protein HYPSUDRAFT_53480 [Hypholoma sublateritium FD-334 SS-4]
MPFSWNFFASESQYRILACLRGTNGPINCLSLTRDGSLLASGADDQVLRIWDIREKRRLQTLQDKSERWGQEIFSVLEREGASFSFIKEEGIRLANFRELSMTNAFSVDDPVESVDYDRVKSRLAVSSHHGRIKMYDFDKRGILALIWEKSMPAPAAGAHCAIPRSIHFTVKGEHLLIFGLESGVIRESKISATGINDWTKSLNSSIGNAFLNPEENILVVDNLVDGFDLYRYPHTAPFSTIELSRKTSFIHGAAFIENGTQIACGSDHGTIYLYSLEKVERTQTLKHGSRRTMIQALDAVSTNDRHIIASGSNDSQPDIVIWERVTKPPQRNGPKPPCSAVTMLLIINFLVVIILALVVGLDRSQKDAIIVQVYLRKKTLACHWKDLKLFYVNKESTLMTHIGEITLRA